MAKDKAETPETETPTELPEAPPGLIAYRAGNASVDGVEYIADETGMIYVRPEHIPSLLEHGHI